MQFRLFVVICITIILLCICVFANSYIMHRNGCAGKIEFSCNWKDLVNSRINKNAYLVVREKRQKMPDDCIQKLLVNLNEYASDCSVFLEQNTSEESAFGQDIFIFNEDIYIAISSEYPHQFRLDFRNNTRLYSNNQLKITPCIFQVYGTIPEETLNEILSVSY